MNLTRCNICGSKVLRLVNEEPEFDLGPYHIQCRFCKAKSLLTCNSEQLAIEAADHFGLRKTINRLPDLKLHVFGHQHYGRGVYKGSNGVYFANCAMVNHRVTYTFS